jgi:hypothetical protein
MFFCTIFLHEALGRKLVAQIQAAKARQERRTTPDRISMQKGRIKAMGRPL